MLQIDDNINKFFYNLIVEYSSKNRPVDNYFIKTVINTIIDYAKLNEFYNAFIIDNKLNSLGEYNSKAKNISINLDAISKKIKKNYYNFTDNEQQIYKYLAVILIILHELEHVNQDKLMKENNSLESNILNESYSLFETAIVDFYKNSHDLTVKRNIILLTQVIKYRNLYYKYYDLAPQERLANLSSYINCLSIVKKFKMTNINNYLKKKSKLTLLSGYKTTLIPTKYYIEKLNPEYDNWSYIEKQSEKLNLKERMSLGLEISKDEYQKVKKKSDKFISK
ncbi:MAG: hypothetical protein IJY25_05025 [Bacilli bacterium]|nr:hypothetical protein [Bacilli bacterium]